MINDTKKAIGLALNTHKPELIAVLKKHGVMVSNSWADHELIMAILVAMRDKKEFRADLSEILSKAAQKKNSFTGETMFRFTGENMYKSFTGENMFQAAGGQKWLRDDATPGYTAGMSDFNYGTTQQTGTTTTPKSGSSTLSSIFSGQNLSNLFNTGVNTVSQILINKSNADLAQTALEIEQQKKEQAALLAAASQGGGSAKPGMSTAAKIGIGLAIVLVVGVGTYFIVKGVKGKRAAKAAKA